MQEDTLTVQKGCLFDFDSSHHPRQSGASELTCGGANTHHQYSNGQGVKDWTTNTQVNHTRKMLCKCLPSPCSLVPTCQPTILSRSHQPSLSQEPRGEPRPPPRRGAGAAPADLSHHYRSALLTHLARPVGKRQQRQRQRHQRLIGSRDGMKISHKPSDRLLGLSFGCMPQPRDTLAAPDPTPQAGIEFSQLPTAAWDRSGLGHEGHYSQPMLQGHKFRHGEETASGAAANTCAHHQTGGVASL